ncbi:MAG: DUF1573 domain-containing protein [Ferruginibacter sp.]
MTTLTRFSMAFFAFLLLSFTIPTQQHPVLNMEDILWKNETIDLGEIPHNKPVEVVFTFTNNGNEAILIDQVITSCGCTVAKYPLAPVLPGASAEITATYNAATLGIFNKSITVNLADKTTKQLFIKGTVID